MSFRTVRVLVVLTALLALAAPPAAAEDIPLRNWSTPPGGHRLSPLADVGAPAVFVGMSPCRVADTRVGQGFTGAYGPPSLAQGSPRTFNIVTSPCTGIPSSVVAFSLNFTVTNTAGPGFLLVYPAGGTAPTVSTLNYVAGQTVANAAIVPAGSGTSITVIAGVSNTDLIIDINGYYMGGGGNLNSGERLWIEGAYAGGAMIRGVNNNTGGNYGGLFESYGQSTTTAGVEGIAWATTNTGKEYGVAGFTYGTMAGSAGVYGYAGSSTAITSGVLGVTAHSVNDSGGVIGRDNTTLPAFSNIIGANGVRGESTYGGVVGVTSSSGRGVSGLALTSGGGLGQWGYLGGGSYGVYAYGNMGASGTKPFVEPHPYRAGAVIRYVALEGPEAGTYFRGRGRFENGTAVIEVPESFRLVSDEDGITVQITPIGRFTQVAVTRIGLDTIEAQSVKDVEFSYLVQGVRKNFKDWQVVVDGNEFMPLLPTSTMPEYLAPGQKETLIRTGVYNRDGTVNMSTARRLGWDKLWSEEQKATKAE